MKICRYCNSVMLSEYETGRNSKSYIAFHNCPKCQAVCDEKVIVYRNGKKEETERWFNPKTKQFEE